MDQTGITGRNNIVIHGRAEQVMVFSHGYGCDQNMWRYVWPAFKDHYKILLFDHVGSGLSDISAYSKDKYGSLEGYADDIIEMLRQFGFKKVIFVGHSVSALIGIIASQKAPDLFERLILVGPSPSYINDGDYVGGFTGPQIDELLESLDNNHLGWSMAMAPVIMGNPDKKELGEELSNSFCRTDPAIAKHFARTTFLTDKRSILSKTTTASLILQCSDDVIAPVSVGEYVHNELPGSELVILKATGHCPNLSAPDEPIDAIKNYLGIAH
jgi:sigma-B regulation protein RsbQ